VKSWRQMISASMYLIHIAINSGQSLANKSHSRSTFLDCLMTDYTHAEFIIPYLTYGLTTTLRLKSIKSFDMLPLVCALFLQHPDAFDQDPEASQYSGLLKAMFLRSERDFEILIVQDKSILDKGMNGFSLFDPVTSLGWTAGCELLYKKGAKIWQPNSKDDLSFLGIDSILARAIESSIISVLKFWIEIAPELSEQQLEHVGYLEDALDFISHLGISENTYQENHIKGYYLEVILEIVSGLAHRRRKLQDLANANRIVGCPRWKRYELANAHALCIYEELITRGVHVPPYLRPHGGNLYASRYGLFGICIKDSLYNAGFRDIDEDHVLPPLLHDLTLCGFWIRDEIIPMLEWFKEKGVNFQVEWPNSRISALHCLAWGLGKPQYLFRMTARIWEAVGHFWEHQDYPDGCDCRCSVSGCLPVTAFLKGAAEFVWDPIGIALRALIKHMAGFSHFLYFTTTIIRFITFERLGIQHTCCDLDRIQYDGIRRRSDPPASPYHYSQQEIRKIHEEDAFLLGLLEELVIEFDNAFQKFDGDFETFVVDVWEYRMKETLRRLRKEDHELYAEGRKQLGVKMEIQDGGSTNSRRSGWGITSRAGLGDGWTIL